MRNQILSVFSVFLLSVLSGCMELDDVQAKLDGSYVNGSVIIPYTGPIAKARPIPGPLYPAPSRTSQPPVKQDGQGQSDLSIKGAMISNPDGNCVDLSNMQNVVIEDSVIGPCSGDGIAVSSSKSLVVKNVVIQDVKGKPFQLKDSSQVEFEGIAVVEKPSPAQGQVEVSSLVPVLNEVMNQ